MRNIEDVIGGILVSLLALALVFVLAYGILDVFMITQEFSSHRVIEKSYVPASSHIGTGVAMSTNGQSGVVVTSSSSPESFILILKSENGRVETLEVTPEEYTQTQIGELITVESSIGKFSGRKYNSKLKTK